MSQKLTDEASKWATGEFLIADAPNPHGLLYEHTRTIATLSIAFLGFSVGFAEKLVTVAKFPWGVWALGAVWTLLVLSIILVLLGSVGVHKYLLLPPPTGDPTKQTAYRKQHNTAAAEIGFAAVFLALAAIAFAAFGGGVMAYSRTGLDAASAVHKATSFLSGLKQFSASQWFVESLTWDEQNKQYKTVLTDTNSKTRYLASVSQDSGDAVSYGQQP